MTRSPIVLGVFVLATLGAVGGVASAQQSRCADCHFANPSAPAANHLADWDRSPHGRNQVGCEGCHRGDATTFESFQAHQGVLNSANPASPVAHTNLPRTCGGCHFGPFVAFQKSRHFELLDAGDTNAPTCSTYHGAVAGQLPSPKGLFNHCSSCHGLDGVAPRPNRAANGRLLLEGIQQVRGRLNEAESLIARVEDRDRRHQAEYDWRQAEVPLIEAANAGHAFMFDNLTERLDTARRRTDALLGRLANPASR